MRSVPTERPRRHVAATVAVLGLLAALEASALGQTGSVDTHLGPVPLRAISPLRLLFFQLTPEGPETLGAGESMISIDISESNVLHIRNSPASEFDAEINLEISRVNVRFRRGVSERVDVGLELPVYRFHSGFLDSYIRNIEDLIGDQKVQRVFEREFPGAGLFRFQLKRDGEVFFERPGPRSGLGDLALTVKRTLQKQSGWRPALSLRGAVKLPTGDDEHAMGSGDVDLALGVAGALDWRRWHFHGTLNATLPFGDPFEAVGLTTPPMVSGHLGFTRRIAPTWAFHFQLGGTSEPFEKIDGREPSPLPSEPFENFGGSIIDGTLGFSHTLGKRTELWIALAEDFQNTTNAASDVTLLASVNLRSW
ncbi:MAG: DUF3187 family protein [Thermoanaerobaculia bacterium]